MLVRLSGFYGTFLNGFEIAFHWITKRERRSRTQRTLFMHVLGRSTMPSSLTQGRRASDAQPNPRAFKMFAGPINEMDVPLRAANPAELLLLPKYRGVETQDLIELAVERVGRKFGTITNRPFAIAILEGVRAWVKRE
jgi:hypothetical protein